VERLGVDTAPVIYFIEANPRYDAIVHWMPRPPSYNNRA
jgi:hypothetical protein